MPVLYILPSPVLIFQTLQNQFPIGRCLLATGEQSPESIQSINKSTMAKIEVLPKKSLADERLESSVISGLKSLQKGNNFA